MAAVARKNHLDTSPPPPRTTIKRKIGYDDSSDDDDESMNEVQLLTVVLKWRNLTSQIMSQVKRMKSA
jgi:hypothetical protein